MAIPGLGSGRPDPRSRLQRRGPVRERLQVDARLDVVALVRRELHHLGADGRVAAEPAKEELAVPGEARERRG